MEKLCKTELAWIYGALQDRANKNAYIMANTEVDSLEYQLANLDRENMKSVARKIQKIAEENHKRICVE